MKYLVLIFTCVSALFSQNAESLFAHGLQLYNAKQYDSAQVTFNAVIQQFGESPELYHNLANCAYRKGAMGEAVLYAKKAYRLDPKQRMIAANVRFLESQLEDEIAGKESNPILDLLTYIHTFFSLSQQLTLLVVLSTIFAVALWITLFRLSGANRIWGIYTAGMILCAIALCGLSSGIKIWQIESLHEAVVLTVQEDIVAEPGSGEVVLSVHEGLTVRVLNSDSHWAKVQIPSGQIGYVREQSLGKI